MGPVIAPALLGLLLAVPAMSSSCDLGPVPVVRDFRPDGLSASSLVIEASSFSSLQMVSAYVAKHALEHVLGYRNVSIDYTVDAPRAPARIAGCGDRCCPLFTGAADADPDNLCDAADGAARPASHIAAFAMLGRSSRAASVLAEVGAGLDAAIAGRYSVAGYVDVSSASELGYYDIANLPTRANRAQLSAALAKLGRGLDDPDITALAEQHVASRRGCALARALHALARCPLTSDHRAAVAPWSYPSWCPDPLRASNLPPQLECIQAIASDPSNGLEPLLAFIEQRELRVAIAWLGDAYWTTVRARLRQGVPTLAFDTAPTYAFEPAAMRALPLECPTCAADVPALMLTWQGLGQAAPAVGFNLRRLLISPSALPVNSSAPKSFETLACDWLRSNRRLLDGWQSGLPPCSVTQHMGKRVASECTGGKRELSYYWTAPAVNDAALPSMCFGGEPLPRPSLIPCDYADTSSLGTVLVIAVAALGLAYAMWIVRHLVLTSPLAHASGYSAVDRYSRLAMAGVCVCQLAPSFFAFRATTGTCSGVMFLWGSATDLMGYALFSALLRARLHMRWERHRNALADEREELNVNEDIAAVRRSLGHMMRRAGGAHSGGEQPDLLVDLVNSMDLDHTFESPRRQRNRGAAKQAPSAGARTLGMGAQASGPAPAPPNDPAKGPHWSEYLLLAMLALQLLLSALNTVARDLDAVVVQAPVSGHGTVEHRICPDRGPATPALALLYAWRVLVLVGALLLALAARLEARSREPTYALAVLVSSGLLNEVAFSATDTRLQTNIFLLRITTGGVVTFLGLTAFCLSLVKHAKFFAPLRQAQDEDPRKSFQRIRARDLEFEELLGQGAYGEVLRATYAGMDVAVKHIGSRTSGADFANEMEALGMLRHPNIVLFIGYCRVPRFLVMEFMPNGTLHDVLHVRRARLPDALAYSTLLDVARGLFFLHARTPAMLHRDIKSPNVLYDDSWRAKVSDFGLSRLTVGSGMSDRSSVSMRGGLAPGQGETSGSMGVTSQLRRTGSNSSRGRSSNKVMPVDDTLPAGTMLWAAPEVARSLASTAHSDVYSFGVVMFEVLFRKLPYASLPSAAVPLAITSGKRPQDLLFRSDDHARAAISPMLQPLFDVMVACLQFEPANRPTMQSVVDSLNQSRTSSIGSDAPRMSMDFDDARDRASSADDEEFAFRDDESVGAGRHGSSRARLPVARDAPRSMGSSGHLVLDTSTTLQKASSGTDSEVDPRNARGSGTGEVTVVEAGALHQPPVWVSPRSATAPHGPPPTIVQHVAPADAGASPVAAAGGPPGVEARRPAAVDAARTAQRPNGHDQPHPSPHEHHQKQQHQQHQRPAHEHRPAPRHLPAAPRPGPAAAAGGPSEDADATRPRMQSSAEARAPTKIIDANELTLAGEIGAGSFGRVYAGSWRGNEVAVKVILTGRGKSSIASLVKQEVNMLARLAHPALLRLHGVCFTGMQTFIVTEYMDRGSLLDIYRGTPRPEPLDMHICQSAEALAVLFSGLAYLHQQRPPMIHRDIKSPNILVHSPFECKIADFGASRLVDSVRTMTRTGTPMWVAPEVLRGERYSELCDVYSMSVVAVEFLNWTEPYLDNITPHELMKAVALHGKRPVCSAYVPESVRELVELGLSDTSSRPPAAEMTELWEAMASSLGRLIERR